MTVLWRDIEGYEGLYKISNDGDVMRLYKDSRKANKYRHSRILKPCWRGRYLFVTLSKENKKENATVSRLVAKAFIPNPKSKPEVNHKDGDRSHNAVGNLEWATSSENTVHAIKLGLRTTSPTVA